MKLFILIKLLHTCLPMRRLMQGEESFSIIYFLTCLLSGCSGEYWRTFGDLNGFCCFIFPVVSALLFAIGTAGVFLRRNVITILLSIEIMLNAVNLTFVAAGRQFASVDGQVIVFFVMTVAAAEAAVGLALVIALFRHRESLNPEAFTSLKW